MRLKFLMMAFVLIAASLSFAAPASAAPGATILSVTFDPATCLLTTVFQVEDAGDYFVTLYDDGVLLAGGGGNFPAGSTQAIYITIGGPDGSPGVAVGVRESLLSPTAFDFLNGEFWTDPEGIDCQERGFVFGQYHPSVAEWAHTRCRMALSCGTYHSGRLHTLIRALILTSLTCLQGRGMQETHKASSRRSGLHAKRMRSGYRPRISRGDS